ncbi:MAG: nucleotide sugar dehydrogenase [Thermoplasmata archaeon]
MGLGYVGLPLAMAFAQKFKTIGYDINGSIIEQLKFGRSNIDDIPNFIIRKYLKKTFFPTSNENNLKGCDFYIICVPTPLGPNHKPDLTYIMDASQRIRRNIKKGAFVILESTTYPGTTEEVVGPIIEEGGLKAGIDFGLAFSPERIDPGNKKWRLDNTPKVIAGITPECTDICERLYSTVIKAKLIRVSNPRTAEAVKLVENIFRGVNIALVNELALIFEKMGIDTWEVIDAAATKPHSFMAHYPGPGVGGHCIPLDPFYMAYKAEQYGIIPRFITTAGLINEYMPTHVVNLLQNAMAIRGKRIRDSRILLLGVAYKKNISDVRGSPAIEIIKELRAAGAKVSYYDPYVPAIKLQHNNLKSQKIKSDFIKQADAVIITTNHDEFRKINSFPFKKDALIIDCFNHLKNIKTKWPIICLGKPNNANLNYH